MNATEGGQNDVAVYLNASAALAVNTSDQPVSWARFHLADGMSAVRSGSQQQPVLEKDGDNLRIDWGYLYLAAPPDAQPGERMGSLATARTEFGSTGKLTAAILDAAKAKVYGLPLVTAYQRIRDSGAVTMI